MAGALRELTDCEVVPLRRSLIPVARPCCDDGDMTDNARRPLTRRARLWAAAEARGVPLRTILAVALVVIAVYMLAKVVYRLRDVLLLIIVAAFIAVILNPAVVALQRWKIKRRGWAVAVVTFWGLIVFAGLAFAFGYPLANGINHLALKLPGYAAAATHGRGWTSHPGPKYHLDRLRRPRLRVRLPAGQRDQPPGPEAAGLRGRGDPRPGLDRPSRDQVSR